MLCAHNNDYSVNKYMCNGKKKHFKKNLIFTDKKNINNIKQLTKRFRDFV